MKMITFNTSGKTTVRDMTEGSIVKQVTMFALPLMLGNVFQMLYNTVDSIVVGNFIGKQALAAVGSTTMIVNMMVFFFNGFSIGAGVIIANYFGNKDMEKLHRSIETTMAFTLILCVIFTIAGVMAVEPMLRMMATPDDVFREAAVYLKIYIGGISGLLTYNMGSSVLRAVGDTTRPLHFLIFTSVLNIILDLVFVVTMDSGIAGVAWATILSQFVSALLIVILLSCSRDIYRLTWHDLRIDKKILGSIIGLGFPAGIQSVITAFFNIFVQSYINFFESSCMAGWGCYNKLEQFVLLPMQSVSMAATTFVSQNNGAGKQERANKGTIISIIMSASVTTIIATLLCVFAVPALGLFSPDEEVIQYGVLFVRANSFFLLFNCVNHVLAAALRGRGDSKGPMICMLLSFVGIRQIYLYVVTRFVANTPLLVGFGYPVGWITCTIIEVAYFFMRRRRPARGRA